MENMNNHFHKNNFPMISDKEILLVKKTYRKITEQYYEDPSEINAKNITEMNTLLRQTISNKKDADRLAILSVLEILKVKSKNNAQLAESVQKTIDHIKSPNQKSLSFKTILSCFESRQLFSIGCTFAFIFYNKLLKSSNLQWKQLISQIGKNPSINTQMCLELLNIICKDNQGNAKHVVKSGFLKFIISCYLEQKIEQKYLLYKALKFLKFISNADRTVIRERQRPLAQVIYKYDQYIPIIEELCKKCYDEQYCLSIYQKTKYDTQQLDLTYLWSFNESFSKKIPENNVKSLLKLIESASSLTTQNEVKIYAILNNIIKFSKINIEKTIQKIPQSNKALLNYLKMISNAVQNNSEVYKRINFSKLQKLVMDDQNPKSQKMLKYIQSLETKQKRTSHLSQNLLEMFSIQKNADMLMQNAGKVPKNNQDLKVIKQILKQKQGNNQFQSDVLNSIKGKALQSLSNSVIQRNKIDLNSLIKQVDFTNIFQVTKLLKIIQIGIMMEHFQESNFDKNRILQMIEWIQNNYQGQLIDWGSIGQILMIFWGQQAWRHHLSEIPNRSFWLLGCIDISERQFDDLCQTISRVLKSQNSKSYKLALILGFLGKTLNKQQKATLINKFSQYFRILQENIKNQLNWKTNLYMQSLFLFEWHQKDNQSSNKIFQKIIQPVHKHIINNFKSTEHEYRYLEACLPYKIPVEKILDNIDFLLSQYGKLASYVYQNTNPKPNVNYDKISNISNVPESQNDIILQILKFLKQNNQLVQGQQINRLFKKVLQNDYKYWSLYPNFVSIINSLLDIIGKTQNTAIIKNLTQIINDLINHFQANQQITPQQKDQIMESLLHTLKDISQKGIHLDLERLKRVSKKIQNQNIQKQILEVLDTYKIQQKQKVSQPQNNNVNISPKPRGIVLDQPKKLNKSKIPVIQSQSPDRNYMTTLQGTNQDNENKQEQKQKEHLWIDEKQQNKVNIQINNLDITQNQKPQESLKQMTVIQALRKIKKMNQKKCDTSEFSKCIDIIMRNKLKSNQKDILGHLLVQFYHIQKHPAVLKLLLDNEKTNLSKEACYQIVKKHVQAFALADRWKLLGRQWLDIAVQRMSEGFFSAACQVIQYNLINIQDLQYFADKKYHAIITKNIYKVENQEDAIFYLLLIGTSARLAQVKKFYIKDQIHLSILNYIEKYQTSYRISANLFYALSSLVYIQPEICLQIVKKESQMIKLLNSLKENYDSRAVVESGGCFIANMAYSNDEVKQALRKYGIIQKLVYIFGKNLEDPEIPTFKQLLRSFGNLSLSQKCAREIIDSNFCELQVKMIQTFNMFMNLDENKLKILKIAIDVLANLCSHKYNLPVMHSQRVTLTIIMLLQTTQINPPIIMGCIDTIDGLCQNAEIQEFAVYEKKLPYILIDILKIQEDQKIIVKATRLLTNLTINVKNIPSILEANLLSVLANIVMPSFFMKYNKNTELNYLSNNPTASSTPNSKMELYINKILVRIYNSKPKFQLLLKSGYLDCLVRTIQTADNLQDVYIEILGSYAKVLPNFLNKRAFMCLIRVLTRRIKNQQIIQKCLKIFKILLLRSYDRDQQDVVIEDSPKMYEKLLDQYRTDALFLLSLHCTISKKLRRLLIAKQKEYKVIPVVYDLTYIEEYKELANTVLFTLFNREENVKKQIQYQTEQNAYKILKEGFICQLYRIDGSSKKAKIMLNEDNNIVAFKYPGGQIKGKYSISLKNLRDWQFDYQKNSRQWKLSIFTKNKGMFSSEVPPQNCCTLIGGIKWGQVAYINVTFNSQDEKNKFKKALDTILFVQN